MTRVKVVLNNPFSHLHDSVTFQRSAGLGLFGQLADLAAFMLEQLAQSTYVRRTPALAC